jgi:GNAT superfamily N-acetyltransferase
MLTGYVCYYSKKMEYRVERDAPLDYLEVHELRLAVGWPSDPERQRKEIENCYANFSVRLNGRLVGYLNVISDGVSDALLNNLIVHPDYQRQGIGKSLLETAVKELSKDGVMFFNLVFKEELVPFYKKCGFHIMRAGIIDLNGH